MLGIDIIQFQNANLLKIIYIMNVGLLPINIKNLYVNSIYR